MLHTSRDIAPGVVLPELDSCLCSILLHKMFLISLLQALAIPQNFIPQQNHMNKTLPKEKFAKTTLWCKYGHAILCI